MARSCRRARDGIHVATVPSTTPPGDETRVPGIHLSKEDNTFEFIWNGEVIVKNQQGHNKSSDACVYVCVYVRVCTCVHVQL